MKMSVRISAVLLTLVLGLSIWGCAGGGSGSPAQVTDGAAITGTINGFMNAMSAGDSVSAKKYLSSKLLLQVTPTEQIGSLTLYDFGYDINNNADDSAWTFSIPKGGIIQPSPDYAEVTAQNFASDGTTMTVLFTLVREQGVWYIDSIDFTSTSSGTSTINAATYFPLNKGDYWKYTIVDSGSGSTYHSTSTIASDPITVDGKKFYPIIDLGNSTATPSTPASVLSRISPVIMASDGPLNTASGVPEYFSNEFGIHLYINEADFNGGKPVKFLDSSVYPGMISSGTYTRTYLGTAYTIDFDMTVGSPESFVTPIQTFTVIPLTFIRKAFQTGQTTLVEGSKEIIYLAANVGQVGLIEYDYTTGSQVSKETLLEASVGGVIYKAPTTTTGVDITTTTLPSGTVGTAYSQTLVASGGTSPYVWSVVDTLPTNFTLSTAGMLSGTPIASGSFSFSIRVADAAGTSDTQAYTLTIVASTTTPASSSFIITTTSPLANATIGQTYTATLAVSGGTSPYAYSLATGSTLPPGLNLSSNRVTGTPTATGTYTFTIVARDGTFVTTSKEFSLTVLSVAVSGAMKIEATLVSASTIRMDFFDTSSVATAPDSTTAAVLSNYTLTDNRYRKLDNTNLSVTYMPTATTLGSTSVTLTFGQSLSTLPNWTIQAANILSAGRTLQVATSPVILKEHISFLSFKPWTDFGFTTASKIPYKIKNPGESGSTATLFFVAPDQISSIVLEETTVGGNVQLGMTTTVTQWFTAQTNPGVNTFFDFLQTVSGSSKTLWGFYGISGGTEIASQPFTTGITATSRTSGTTAGATGQMHFDTFDFYTGTATVSAMLLAETTQLRGVDWGGSAALSNTATTGVGATILAMDSYHDGSSAPAEIRLIDSTGMLKSVSFPYSGSTSAPATLGTFPGSTNYGLFWMKNLSGNADQYLCCSAQTNGFFLFNDATNTNIYGIGDPTNTDIKGRLNAPRSITVFASPTYNATTAPFNYWILVADADGLSIYRRY